MKLQIGIDEVGRGPVAGPVAVAAFSMSSRINAPIHKGKKVPIRDSKKLTHIQRELWYAHLCTLQKDGLCDFSVTMVSAKIIDRIGIAPAIERALAKSLTQINAQITSLVLLDGGLKAPQEFKKQKTIIKGDEKEKAIALASIVAKVTRDRYMYKQAKKYPEYGFEKHVGYGTRAHYDALRQYGTTPLHRSSFLRNL